MAKKKEVSEKKRNKVNKKDDLSKYIPSDYEKPLGIEFSKKETSDKKTNQDGYDEIHGSLYKMTHNNTIPWRNYLVYAVLLTFLTCAFTFSKYSTKLTSNDSTATVASFKYSITGDFTNKKNVTVTQSNSSDEIDCAFNSSTSKDYKFTIENKGEVTVIVTVTPSNYGKFVISLDGTTIDSSKTNKSYELTSGASKTITMKINPSNASNGDTAKMSLNFKIDQKD